DPIAVVALELFGTQAGKPVGSLGDVRQRIDGTRTQKPVRRRDIALGRFAGIAFCRFGRHTLSGFRRDDRVGGLVQGSTLSVQPARLALSSSRRWAVASSALS